jgi:hypothetical protein
LSLAPSGSVTKIMMILRGTPPSWQMVLNMHSVVEMIQSSNFNYNQIIMLACMDTRNSLAIGPATNGAPLLAQRNCVTPHGSRPFVPCFAAITSGQSSFLNNVDESPKLWGKPKTNSFVIESDKHAAEVYVALSKETPKQRFYPFMKRKDIKTSLKLLPWPCCACGLTQHWYNKCKDQEQYKHISKKQGYAVEQNPRYDAI